MCRFFTPHPPERLSRWPRRCYSAEEQELSAPGSTQPPLRVGAGCGVIAAEAGMRRRLAGAGAIVLAIVVLAVGASFFIDEPLRRYVESQMNQRLDGYTVRIGRLDFHPLGFSIDFENLLLTQNAHPDPAVSRI